jgi:hypothetical protein
MLWRVGPSSFKTHSRQDMNVVGVCSSRRVVVLAWGLGAEGVNSKSRTSDADVCTRSPAIPYTLDMKCLPRLIPSVLACNPGPLACLLLMASLALYYGFLNFRSGLQ